MKKAFLFLCFALALGAWTPGPAHAGSKAAAAGFKAAKELYDAGDFADALAMFQVAWQRSRSPNARLFVARCHLKLGNHTAAYDAFKGTVLDAGKQIASNPKYRDTQNAAAVELVLLEPRVGKLVVMLSEGVPDAVVTLNGHPYPAAQLGKVSTIAPGLVKLSARAPGYRDVFKEVAVHGGEATAVALWLTPISTGKPAGGVVAPEESLGGVQILGLVTAGIGVAGLMVGGGFGVAASSKLGALEDGCSQARCSDAGYAEVIDSGKTYETASYISLGAGGAALLGGALMYLLGEPSVDGPDVAALPLPGGGMVSYGVSF